MPDEREQTQSERFKRAAEEAGVELDEEQLKRALRKMKDRGADQKQGGSDEG